MSSTPVFATNQVVPSATDSPGSAPVQLERRGRNWLLWSFIFCPCHLPLSLGVLAAVLAGRSLGAVLRDHMWVAGTVITLTWVAGTAYGFHLIRKAQKTNGACPVPNR